MAELVDKLFERYGVAVLGFDVVWAERDPSSGIEVLDADRCATFPRFRSAYAKLRPGLDFDAPLRREHEGPAGGARLLLQQRGARGARPTRCPAPVLPKGTFDGRRVFFPGICGYTGNLPLYLESAAGAGHINPRVDFDGVLRRVPLIVEYDGAVLRGVVARRGARAARAPDRRGAAAGGAGLSARRPEPGVAAESAACRSRSTRKPAALVPYRGARRLPLHLARRRGGRPRRAAKR